MSLSRAIKDGVWDALAHPIVCKLWKFYYGGMGSILMFHRVVEKSKRSFLRDNQELEVTPPWLDLLLKTFQRQRYHFASLDEIPDLLKKGRRRFVAFTFDDGYADNLTLGYPVFQRYRAPFTVYVCTDFPNQKAKLWWYLLEDILIQKDSVEFSFEGNDYRWESRSMDQKSRTFEGIKGLILSTDPSKLDTLFAKLGSLCGKSIEAYVQGLAMSWDQVRELAKDPLVTIGAHSLSHLPLKRLSEERAWEEIETSRKIIEKEIGRPVKHFAYPFGAPDTANTREFEMVRRQGFVTATTTREGNLFSEHFAHTECLPRFQVDDRFLDPEGVTRCLSGYFLARSHQFQRVITS